MTGFQLYLSFAVTWWYLILVFTGVGLLLYRGVGLKVNRVETLFLAFWAGWACLFVFLQFWSFFSPVNGASRIIFTALGLSGLVWNASAILDLLRGRYMIARVLFYAFFIGFTVWVANRSLNVPTWVWDTGLYHLDAIKWANTYPVVPGLGNLHSRLGFSSTYFLFPAWINVDPWYGKTFHVANSLLFLVLSAQMVRDVFVSVVARRIRPHNLFNILFVPIIWWFLLTEETIPNISNDPPLFAIGLLIVSQIVSLIHQKEMSRREALFRLIWIVLMASVGIAIKFSFVLLGILLALVALLIWLREYHSDFNLRRTVAVIVLLGGIALIVVIPMMTRSVIMTGYPAYPVTALPFDVDWRISEERAELETRFIQSWARLPNINAVMDEVLSGWGWFRPWRTTYLRPRFLRVYLIVTAPVALFTLSVAALWFTRSIPFLRKRGRYVPPYYWLIFGTLIANTVFWFLTAPAPRFAGSTFWVAGVLVAVATFYTLSLDRIRWLSFLLPPVLAVLILFPFRLSVSIQPWIETGRDGGLYTLREALERAAVRNMESWLLGEYGKEWPEDVYAYWLERTLNELYPVSSFETRSGLIIQFPEQTNQCWDAEIPCTPYPHPALSLRNPDDISDGFMMNILPGDPPLVID